MELVEPAVSMPEELLQLVDEAGRPLGTAPRTQCHGRPELLHAVVHVLIFHPDGRVLMQRRAPHKDIAPGRWDCAVGGHLEPGETPLAAARRETAEELGRDDLALRFVYTWIWRGPLESEWVTTFTAVDPGPWRPDPAEITALEYWSRERLTAALGSELLTRNFDTEWQEYLRYEKGCTP